MVPEGKRKFGTDIGNYVNRVCSGSENEKLPSYSVTELSKTHKEKDEKLRSYSVTDLSKTHKEKEDAQRKIEVCTSNCVDDNTMSTASPIGVMSPCSSFGSYQESPSNGSFARDLDQSWVEKQSISEEPLQHSGIEARFELSEHELHHDIGVVSPEGEPQLSEAALLVLEDENSAPFEKRVFRELFLKYDEGDTASETVSSVSEFSTEGLAELQDRRIHERIGERYDFEIYCD